MQHSRSLEDEPLRQARRDVMTKGFITAKTGAQLEARGIDVGAMERRLIELNRFGGTQ